MATHGNYQGYQGSAARHTPTGHNLGAHILDPRLTDLVQVWPGLFDGKRVLDVGCNQGGVAVDIALHFKAASVHGIDLDPTLIRQAKSHLSFVYSRLPPSSASSAKAIKSGPASGSGAFAFGATPQESAYNASYFPVSSVSQHGHVLYPLEGSTDGFPRNVSFEVADVVDLFGLGQQPQQQQQQQELEHGSGADDAMAVDLPEPMGSPRQMMQQHQRKRQTSINGSLVNVTALYDAILLLSVLKWIHIHNSDAILPPLFAAINNALSPGGVMVVEVQEWESYEKAAKKNPGLKGKVQALQVREWEQIVEAALKAGFEVVGEVEEKRDAKGKIRRRRMVGFGKV